MTPRVTYPNTLHSQCLPKHCMNNCSLPITMSLCPSRSPVVSDMTFCSLRTTQTEVTRATPGPALLLLSAFHSPALFSSLLLWVFQPTSSFVSAFTAAKIPAQMILLSLLPLSSTPSLNHCPSTALSPSLPPSLSLSTLEPKWWEMI